MSETKMGMELVGDLQMRFTKIVSVMSFKDKGARDETAKFAVNGHASTMLRLESLLKALQS